MFKKFNEWREKRRAKKLAQSFTNLSPRAQRVVKTVAVIGLAAIVVVAFVVSFTNLHMFMLTFGKLGMYAVLTAALVDAMTILSLLVALTFRSASARVGFVLGLLGTAVANATIGYLAAGPVGLAVGLIPVIAMESAYKTVLDLVFTPDSYLQDHQETSTQLHQTTSNEPEEGLEVLEDYQEPEVVILENPVEEFWSVPNTVEELQEEAPAPATASTKPPVGFTPYSKEQVVSILQARGEVPGRPTIMKEFGVSDWTARQIVTELKNH